MPNDTVTAKRLPVADIVTVTESACKSLAKKIGAKVINIMNKHD